jgi:hypothetical protein
MVRNTKHGKWGFAVDLPSVEGRRKTSGYDPGNKVTLVLWSNLTVAPDGRPTANVLLLKVAVQIYHLPAPAPPSTIPLPGDDRRVSFLAARRVTGLSVCLA